MRRNKDLQFCIDQLSSMLNRSGCEPEQKSALEAALGELKCLRRKSKPDKHYVYGVVRTVAEALINNFKR
jgi:hypothetical protein